MSSIFHELSKYPLSNLCSMGYSFLTTKLFYPKARLIRRPFYIRQKKNLQYGEGFTTGHGCRFEMFENGKIVFGKDCHIGDHVHIAALHSITIGNNCLFASKIFISDLSHGSYGVHGDSPLVPPNERPLTGTPVHIGDNVWIGENVCVLSGVTIGSGCVIGSNATVIRDLPRNCIAVGSPAKPIKIFDEDSQSWIPYSED